MSSERMKTVFEKSRELAKKPPQSTFTYDLHTSALTLFKDLPVWEKQARAMAYAIENQEVFVFPHDKLFGHVFYRGEKKPEKYDPDFDVNSQFVASYAKDYPTYRELLDVRLIVHGLPGHISWNWNAILQRGTDGIRERCETGLFRHKGDEEAEHFYKGILIILDAVEKWNEKHVQRLIELGRVEEAEICRRVPKQGARSFREALQSFFMQHIIVMKENPHGGNSPGRLDYYLWPYLKKDLEAGVITLDEAQELIEELFLRIDERLYLDDGWGESIVIGGTHLNGEHAITPLTYIMLRAYMKYDITHPLLYCRVPENPPKEYLDAMADYVINGQNRAQLLGDKSIIAALVKNGVTEADAVDYYAGGCMEIGSQGRQSDLLFAGYQNIPKILELCMSGGYCLKQKKQLDYFKTRPLTEFDSFEDFYAAFISEAEKVLTESLRFLDKLSAHMNKKRPAYLISSMVEDCLGRGRGIHGGGAKYHDYGSSLIGIPNTADSLTAIKLAVFDYKICTAGELLDALKADFEGYEALRAKLLALPKYGQENADADAMVSRLCKDLYKIYNSYINRFGGNAKIILLTYIWGPLCGGLLGATPDGRRAFAPVAHSITPQSSAMTKGITAAINSCTTLPYECFGGGASSMWDLDPSIATPEIVSALITTFFEQGGQIFQGNTTDVEELKRAKEHPEDYGHLIVRVGGYSARFVWLNPALQNEIINRIRHKG